MNALVVFAHPEPDSFNAALKDVAVERLRAEGHSVVVSDLYAEGFDPVEGPCHYAGRADPLCFAALAEQRHAGRNNALPEDVEREIRRLEAADLVIFQFPLWWHAQPAILKGWFDRVFVNGLLYTSSRRYDRGAFRGKRALVSVTAGAPAAAFGPGGRGGDIDALLWPFHYSLHYMGFSVLAPFLSFGVAGHGYSYAAESAQAAALEARKTALAERLPGLMAETPLRFNGWADWDVEGRARTG